jgi:hypothetical protein
LRIHIALLKVLKSFFTGRSWLASDGLKPAALTAGRGMTLQVCAIPLECFEAEILFSDPLPGLITTTPTANAGQEVHCKDGASEYRIVGA